MVRLRTKKYLNLKLYGRIAAIICVHCTVPTPTPTTHGYMFNIINAFAKIHADIWRIYTA